MTDKPELVYASFVFLSTLATGSLIADFIVGIATYTTARLFYHYYDKKIINIIDRIKSKLRTLKNKIFKKK